MTSNLRAQLTAQLQQRILILDGGMGTMIQRCKFSEEDYRGTQYADWPSDLKGNNDLLCITQRDRIKALHKGYLDAGADIVMLDELSDADMRTAVTLNAGRAKLEASGGITEATLRSVAETGVDYISIGSLTKDIKAVDLSMRLRFQAAS